MNRHMYSSDWMNMNIQVSDRVWAKVSTQVGSQIEDRVWDHIWNQSLAQFDNQINSQIRRLLINQVRDHIQFL